jgi:hypothetical protein
MIELQNEALINVTSLPGILPPGRNGKRLNYATIWRWIFDGVKTPTGRVRLEAVKCGARWLTSMPALERFVAAQTPPIAANDQCPTRSPSQRQRASDDAARALKKLGI